MNEAFQWLVHRKKVLKRSPSVFQSLSGCSHVAVQLISRFICRYPSLKPEQKARTAVEVGNHDALEQ